MYIIRQTPGVLLPVIYKGGLSFSVVNIRLYFDILQIDMS